MTNMKDVSLRELTIGNDRALTVIAGTMGRPTRWAATPTSSTSAPTTRPERSR